MSIAKNALKLFSSFKRTLCVVLALCIAITAFSGLGLFSANAADKTMLYVKWKSGSHFYLHFADSTAIEADETYTLQFKANMVSGSNTFKGAHISKTTDWANTNLKSFIVSESSGGLSSFDFTLSSSDLSGVDTGASLLAARFEFNTGDTSELYLGDLKVFKKSDATKTNLLKNGDTASGTDIENWKMGFGTWGYSGSFVGKEWIEFKKFEYVAFDKTILPEAASEKLMLHGKTTQWGHTIYLSFKEALVADKEYKAEFRLHQAKGTSQMGKWSVCGAKNILEAPNETNTTYTSGSNLFIDGKELNEISFKLSNENIANFASKGWTTYYFGISVPSSLSDEIEYYLADLIVYDAADANKTNLLDAEDIANWESQYKSGPDFVSGHNYSVFEYTAFDETIFPPLVTVNTMLHGKTTQWGHTLALKTTENLVVGTEYALEFKLAQPNGGPAITKAAVGCTTGSFNGGDTTADLVSWDTVSNDPTVLNKFTFTYTQEMADKFTEKGGVYNYARLAIPAGNQGTAVEYYLAGFRLYATGDAKETNLLKSDVTEKKISNWLSNYTSGDWFKQNHNYSIFEYTEYDRLIFKEKSMLHIAGGANQNLSWFTTTKAMPAAGEYTLEYRMNIYEGNGPTGPALAFTKAGSAKNNRTDLQDNVNLKSLSDRTDTGLYTFTITEEQLEAAATAEQDVFRVGFKFPNASSKMYVTDFVLYKSDDAEKTNLLSVDDTTRDASAYWKRSDDLGVTWEQSILVEYVDYDETKFPEPEKTMLHGKTTQWGHTIWVSTKSMLEADVEYAVEFKVNQTSGAAINYAVISSGKNIINNPGNADVMTLKKFENIANIPVKTNSFNFTLSADDIAASAGYSHTNTYFGLGIPDASASGATPIEFYLANLTLYRVDDASKENLLVVGETANIKNYWRTYYGNTGNWFAQNCKYSVFEYIPFNEEYFPSIDSSTMYHMISQQWSATIGTPTKAMVKANTEYTVSYQLNQISGDAVKEFDLYFGNETTPFGNKIRYGEAGEDGVWISGKKEMFNKSGRSDLTEFNFSFTEDEIAAAAAAGYDKLYVSFLIPEARANQNKTQVELYINGLTLYESADSGKANLLHYGPYAFDTNKWVNGSGAALNTLAVYPKSEYLMLDEELFPEPQKTMLHFASGCSDVTWFTRTINTPVAGDYVLTYREKTVNGSAISDVVLGFSREDTGKSEYRTEIQGADETKLTDVSTNDIETIYNFTITEEQVTAAKADGKTDFVVGFKFPAGTNEAYMADLVLYKKDDSTKTNLLVVGEYANMAQGSWRRSDDLNAIYQGSELLKYVPYDENTVPKQKTMLKVVSKWYGHGLYLQTENPLEANVEYKVSYKLRNVKNHTQERFSIIAGNGNFGSGNERTLLYANFQDAGIIFEDESEYYNQYEYTFTLSEDQIAAAAAKDYNKFYVCFSVPNGEADETEFYIADLNIHRADDADKTNLMKQNEYSRDITGWYTLWGWTGASTIKPEAYQIFEYVDYDESVFELSKKPAWVDQMLHFVNGAKTVVFAQRIRAEVGKTYIFEYSLTTDAKAEDFGAKGLTDGNRNVWSEGTRLGLVDHGHYTRHTYSLTVPEKVGKNDMTWFGFIGVNVPFRAEGYIFDINVYEDGDATKTNLYPNKNFKNGLDDHIWGWGGWFIGDKNKPDKTNGHWGTGWTAYNLGSWGNIDLQDLDHDKLKAFMHNLTRDDGEWWKAEDLVEVEEEAGISNVKGTLVDDNGNPVTNTKVLLVGLDKTYTATTNAKGEFEFKDIVSGFYELFFEDKSGEQINSGYFANFENGDTVTLTIVAESKAEESTGSTETEVEEKEPKGSLMGNIYTPDLKVVKGIKVYLRAADGTAVADTVTDDEGYFEFLDVAVGDYEIYTIIDESGTELLLRKATVKENTELSMKLKYDTGDTSADVDTEEESNLIWILLIIAGAVVLLIGAGIIVLVVLTKKKKNQ